MSEEIMYADVVFPATTYYENQIPVSSPLFGWKLSKIRNVIQPLGESKKRCSYFTGAGMKKWGFGEALSQKR